MMTVEYVLTAVGGPDAERILSDAVTRSGVRRHNIAGIGYDPATNSTTTAYSIGLLEHRMGGRDAFQAFLGTLNFEYAITAVESFQDPSTKKPATRHTVRTSTGRVFVIESDRAGMRFTQALGDGDLAVIETTGVEAARVGLPAEFVPLQPVADGEREEPPGPGAVAGVGLMLLLGMVALIALVAFLGRR